jgi:hypothetical protein
VIESTTASLNSFTSSANDRLNTIESTTGSLNTFTSSANGKLTSLESASGSIRTDFNSYTSSNDTTNTTQNSRLNSIEGVTGSVASLNIYTGSNNAVIETIQTATSSLNTFTSSASGRLNSLESASGSIRTDFNTYTGSNNTTNESQNNRLTSLETTTGSLNSYTSSNNTNISAIHTSTSSLNSHTSSTNTKLTSIETSTSSLNTFTSSASGRLTSLESASGSIRSDFNSFTSSNNAVESTQNGRLTSLENVTGSYATTGSNIFIGNQTITGSLFISQNLIVQGSSSLENITASAVSIGTNTIILNTDSPAFRYAGISVFDSGSTNVTASLFYDSLTNQWKFKHVDTGTNDASIMLFGPLGNDIDSAPLLDGNFLTKVENNGHGHHITTSSIFDNGTKVSINSNSEITGSLTVTGVVRSTTTPLVSSSIQIDHNATTNYVANRHIDHTAVSITTLAGSGLTGGGDITTTRDLSITTGGVTNAMLAGSIENGKLSNSSLTIGTTAISLGGSSTTLGGLSSVTSTSFTGSLQGNISGNAATVTTNANLTGVVTSTGNITTIANGNITNAMLAGSIENGKLSNSSFFIGTTSISLGRGSASQTLNGVAIDGNAGSVTNGVYTTGDQSIAGAKTFTGIISVTASEGREITTFMPSSYTTGDLVSGHEYGWYADHWRLGMTRSSAAAGEDFVVQWNAARRLSLTSGGNLSVTGTIGASNLSGTNTGDQTTITGNAGSATILQTARTIGGVSFNGSANIDLPGVNTSGNQNTSGNAATATEVTRTVGAGSEANLLSATIAENDYFRLRVGGGSNAGFVEIATGDDGTEPIHVRQYTGVFSTLTRTATLLDGSGNTSFPGTVTAPTFSGALSGNASTVTNGVYTTGDQSIGGAKTFTETLKVLKNGRTLTIGQDYANHINWDSNVDLALNISNGGTGGIVFFGGGSSSKFSVTAAGVGAFAGNLSAANLSGTNTGDQTNISGTAGSETLSTVTGRGASTSTAISINNTLTVTSGRVIARTGGVNTYGVFSGYDNNNHMMTFRAAVSGPTASPTFTAGHQTTFIEYAGADDISGWFFKSSSSTNYEDVVRITRVGITPGSNGTQNLGSSSARWNTLFTSDLSLSNGIGDYTIVEGEEKLYLYNNKNNKVYSFVLQEEDPTTATPKRPE